MISLYGTTIQVMNFKKDYILEVLDILSDIIEIYDFNESYPGTLNENEIVMMLHDLPLYFELGKEDNNIVTCIRFSVTERQLSQIYARLFEWFSNVLARYPYGFEDVFDTNTRYRNTFELVYATKCIKSLINVV